MYSWGKRIAVCVLLVASFVFLQTPANASYSSSYQVYLSSYDSGLGSTGRIYGKDLSTNKSFPFVFCIEEGTKVTVPGTYFATNTTLTGNELKAGWLMKNYGSTTFTGLSSKDSGIVVQNAIWGVTGQGMNITSYLTIVNDLIDKANHADLTGIASSYVRMNLFTDKDFKCSVQDQIRPVPIPGALWLLGCGLAGLVGIRRRFIK